ncbi:hypothetical protein GCM10018782_30770 [Streptomyces griseoaurantiacus]|nr:hypothetical protein GCM10018782_30770 [Streptomyces griseoaurantiacus]
MSQLGEVGGEKGVGQGLTVDEDTVVIEEDEVIAHTGHPKRRKPRTKWCGVFLNICSAVSYSPTGSPLQYHRRCKA